MESVKDRDKITVRLYTLILHLKRCPESKASWIQHEISTLFMDMNFCN